MAKKGTMAKHLEKIRLLIARKRKATEAEIRAEMEKLARLYFSYLSEEFAMYSEDGILDYAILRKTGRLELLMDKIDSALREPADKIPALITQLAEETYSLSYAGLRQAASKAAVHPVIKKLAGESFINEHVLKRSLSKRLHPLAGFNQKMWRKASKQIRKTVTDGLLRGDRYETMAKELNKSVGITHRRAVTVVRTEVHRIEQVGENDSGVELDRILRNATKVHNKIVRAGATDINRYGPSIMTQEEREMEEVFRSFADDDGFIPEIPEERMTKTWQCMQDNRVRHSSKANHRRNHNQTVLADEKFKLYGGHEADAPGNSGNAADDVNCRCFLDWNIWDMEGEMPTYNDPDRSEEDEIKTKKVLDKNFPWREKKILSPAQRKIFRDDHGYWP